MRILSTNPGAIKSYKQYHYGSAKKRQREYLLKLKQNRICVNCKVNPTSGKFRCEQCLKKQSDQQDKRREQSRSKGLCLSCNRVSGIYRKNTICELCWFKAIAAMTLHGSRKYEIIRNLFYRQQSKCAYTDELLIPGENTALDHKTPVRRGGKHEESNLQWVTKKINGVKRDMTHEEFIALCSQISTKFS